MNVPGFAAAVGPYADVAIGAGQVWVSGVVGMDGAGEVVGADDPVEQIRFALTQLRSALEFAGTSPDRLLHLMNFVTDVELRRVIHQQREAILPGVSSASTLVVVSGLILPELVYEVQAVALTGAG
jgi:enamine deaminase RidA (YjgF/YER057c/UK114 family)